MALRAKKHLCDKMLKNISVDFFLSSKIGDGIRFCLILFRIKCKVIFDPDH